MTITCDLCLYNRNSDKAQFCEICGSELKLSTTFSETQDKGIQQQEIQTVIQTDKKANIIPENSINSTLITSNIVKLIPKQIGAPIPEFIIDSNNAIIGKFNREIGPVEIDLDGFYGNNTVSSTHGEIYFENNQWQIKDIGSNDGIYIKPTGQNRFGYRINKPEILKSGYEIAIGKVRLLFLIT